MPHKSFAIQLREDQRELALKQVDELMTGEEREIRAKEQYKKAQEAAAKVRSLLCIAAG